MRLTLEEQLQMMRDLVFLAKRSNHPNYVDGCAWCAIAFNRASFMIADLYKAVAEEKERVA